jgi:hypothetical protein
LELAKVFKKLWGKFLSLKPWQKATIVTAFVISGIISSATDSSTSTKDVTPSASITPAVSPTPEATVSPSESPTPTASPTPETPIEFRFAALRDLKDMRTDVNDARAGITGNGLGRYYWNVAEINFNLAQLALLLPREEYAERWNSKLEILTLAVRGLSAGEEELTISKAKAQLNKVLNAIPALESVAKSLAN